MNFFCTKTRGFTLVEMIVYIALLSVLSVVVINAVVTTTKTFADFRMTRSINESATTVVERMTRDIRMAYDIDQSESILSAHPGRLVLKTTDASGDATTTEFYIDNGRVRVTEGATDIGYLSGNNVTVDLLVFDFVSNAHTSAVTIRLQLSATQGSLSKTETFYTTTILRGSY